VLPEEAEHLLLDSGLVERGGPHLGGETGAAVRRLIPGVHCRQRDVVLVHDQHRRLGHGRERSVGDDERDLDYAIALGVEPRHLHVDPDEVGGILRHGRKA
jgi:hypothetical protein